MITPACSAWLILGAVVAAGTQDPAPRPWPTKGWNTASPESQGIDADVLHELDAEFASGKHGLVDSMLIVRRGRVVFERHYHHDYAKVNVGRDQTPHQFNYDHHEWHPFFKGTKLHTIQSATKSIASIGVGVAMHRGEIESLETPMLSWFGNREVADPDGRKAKIRLIDVLTMRSGFEWEEWNPYDDPTNDCMRLEASEDWVAYVLAKPMATDPGSTFVYNSGGSHLLSAILQEATGRTIDEYLGEHLFRPIGIDSFHWKKTPKGLPDTEGGLYLRPRDLARIGYLFLNDGVWNGRRFLPEGWVADSIEPRVADIFPDNDRIDPGYGFQWWILDRADDDVPLCYAAMGYGGNVLLVVPELELIGVFTAWNIHGPAPDLPGLFLGRVAAATRR